MPKAVQVQEWGGPEVLKLVDLPRPAPADDEVLIRVRAAGVNPLDWKIRNGARRAIYSLPYVLGCDVAGSVEAAGRAVKGLAPGDAVYSMIGRAGGYAEYAIAKAEVVAPKPARLDFPEAAAVPLAALTAWQMLTENGNLEAGQRVLVHAAAGGVGFFAVQFAHNLGAHVVGTASARNHDFLRALGADELIDYNTSRFEERIRDVDLVVDLLGGQTQARSWQVIRKGGTLVCAAGAPDAVRAVAAGVQVRQQSVRPDGRQLREFAAMFDAGKLRVEIGGAYPLERVADAHRQNETGHTRGKIVLVVGGPA
ncbi:MAG: NADP-dependent oxidoreductase [Burkholderiales bacterium]|nr:NADP-dependent oxidoreductase [Burkholderiales bacterium]